MTPWAEAVGITHFRLNVLTRWLDRPVVMTRLPYPTGWTLHDPEDRSFQTQRSHCVRMVSLLEVFVCISRLDGEWRLPDSCLICTQSGITWALEFWQHHCIYDLLRWFCAVPGIVSRNRERESILGMKASVFNCIFRLNSNKAPSSRIIPSGN